ncbi:MAG TPA: response regulator [Pirellulales bacterium]|jgi:two-component system chemotaxis response regulator CheY|nr:response regulator [Pirellulales bacterium]
MVVDDSRALRRILGDIMRELGFEVVDAGHGREALTMLETTGPLDLVLVDWNMPVMNGLEFVRAVRANAAYESMPLIMVTTETEIEQMQCALESGANEYVMKPFTADVIQDKLRLLNVVCASDA